ncbi:asparagine synthase (glutamine-hydrolyzing), partial [Rhodospirillum rubrum]|nr:asparagine synthase (glutamine-hydrolyzing) [Rhodospirillum rubrum]
MFGFAIWDRRKKQLFAARDHFGIKPFYYYADHTQFAFGSEIKSILSLDGLKPAVNPKSLFHYLTLQYVPQPDTMFEGIKKLEPGHYLTVDQRGNTKKHKYWEPQFEPEHRPIETFVEEIRFQLKESVKLHTQSDVPFGSFLSGGIDSTSIASYLSRTGPIKTFSVGFEGEQNENIYARETATELGIDHFDEVISENRFFEDTIKAVWHMDEPIADPSAIAIYRLSKLAREQITVALSGEGADELFGGYRIYKEPTSLKPLSWIPENLQQVIKQFVDIIPFNFYGKNYINRGLTPLEQRFFGNAKIFTEQEKRLVLS